MQVLAAVLGSEHKQEVKTGKLGILLQNGNSFVHPFHIRPQHDCGLNLGFGESEQRLRWQRRALNLLDF